MVRFCDRMGECDARRAGRRAVVRVQCLRCGHFNVLTAEMLSRLAVSSTTPIAASVKRHRCRECGSLSVLATGKPPQPPIASPITKH